MRWNDPDVKPPSSLPGLDRPAAEVIETLAPKATKERLARFEHVAKGRTDAITVVLDGLSDPHNVSAILRSCEAFGIQHAHIVPGRYGVGTASRVSKGADRWLDLHEYEDSESCAAAIKAAGHKTVIAVMEGEKTPEELADLGPIAIVFGNERDGVSDFFREQADATYSIPMVGFVESLNVSVAAAITLFSASRRNASRLDTSAQQELVARYLQRSVRDASSILDGTKEA